MHIGDERINIVKAKKLVGVASSHEVCAPTHDGLAAGRLDAYINLFRSDM